MFQLTEEEAEELRRKFYATNINSMSRTLPYVFTESGIYMLMTVLNGELAVIQSINIMRAFKKMRHFLIENRQLMGDNKPSKDRLQAFELEDFKLNHPNCKILESNGKVHDRYIALDFETPTEQIYHCGTSSKDAGSKLCTIMKMNDTYMIHIVIVILLSNEELILT